MQLAFFVILAVMVFSQPVCAQDEYKAMVDDVRQSYAHAVATMEGAIDQVQALYADQPDFLERFNESQQAWEVYLAAHLGARFPGDRDNYGSTQRFCVPMAAQPLVEARTALIRQWIEGIVEGDVCGGSLRWVSAEEYERKAVVNIAE